MNGASVFTVLASMAVLPAAAQQQPDSGGLQEVVVTGQRAALEAAQNRKENADQILDSISADDAGKLPDESVTEILQRVPGVSISHFESLGPSIDTNHYSAQGAAVTIRGLSQVESLMNGQETFSANGGRAISFEDIPPELLAGLDVYKSENADEIEGGIGGTVNLRTRLPFDYKKETLNVNVTGNYGDFSNRGEPGGSVLYANRWDTPAGEFGAMFDISYSDYYRRSDQLEVDPYFPQVLSNGKQVVIPNDVNWGTNNTDVKRLGSYEALEWKPNNDVTVWQTGFRSDYWSTEYDDIAISDGSSGSTVPVAGSTNSYNPNGGLVTSTGLYSPQNAYSALPGASGMILAADAGKFWTHNQTTDLSEGVKWNVNDRLQVNSGFQYTYAQSQTYRQEIFTTANVPSFGVNLTGNLPDISVANSSALSNPNNYTWNNYMDHKEDHRATDFAWSGDADYTISEDGLFRSAKVGLRVATHIETDDVSRYNWIGLTPDYESPISAVGAAPSGYYGINNFNNFFGGAVSAPASLAFASKALLDGYPGNLTTLEKAFSPAGTSLTQPVSYDGGSLARQSTDSYNVYGMIRFGNDDGSLLGIPFNGNFGLRLVRDSNSAFGGIGYGSTPVNINGQTLTTVSSYIPNSGGRTFTMPLPSFNIQFLPTEDLHLRFAASQAMSNPSFTQLMPAGYYGLTTNGLQQITGASGSGLGNPNLKPELANQLDASAEYYFNEGGQVHAAAFYKKIHDFITYGTETINLPFQFTNGTSLTQPVAISQYMNTSQATIEGAEIGWQQFFRFLPDPFDGLGLDFNYTYTSSNSPGDLAYDMEGHKINGLPVDMLSRDTINITGMYEKGPLSLRLAYTWRSKYLLTPNGITGTYTSAVTGQSVTYSLPQYNDAYGQLDASFGWRFSDNLAFQFQAVNLANSINKVLMGYGDQQFGHAWYMTDRRYQGTMSMSF
jgi:TonB-dependent receptor